MLYFKRIDETLFHDTYPVAGLPTSQPIIPAKHAPHALFQPGNDPLPQQLFTRFSTSDDLDAFTHFCNALMMCNFPSTEFFDKDYAHSMAKEGRLLLIEDPAISKIYGVIYSRKMNTSRMFPSTDRAIMIDRPHLLTPHPVLETTLIMLMAAHHNALNPDLKIHTPSSDLLHEDIALTPKDTYFLHSQSITLNHTDTLDHIACIREIRSALKTCCGQ